MVETTTAVLDSLFHKNTISLAGQTHKDGNKNMSYHVQQNTQQRSLGIFIVIAFHLLLIWGLANGLGGRIGEILMPKDITITPQQKKVTPKEQVTPDDVVVKPKDLTTTPPIDTPFTFETDPVIDHTGNGTGDPIIQTTQSISKPRIIKATKPDYPTAASRMGEEGVTGLSLFITVDGRVAEAKVFSSSGSSRLDDAAIKHALRSWAFTPCMEGEKAVACWHQTKLVWRLEDAKR
ncbi:MAG: energy transducer TonB [Gammaproteobacteria bacterium]|nr:MAG: energy transducer TonB [Gammaproteobacteria bacterium]